MRSIDVQLQSRIKEQLSCGDSQRELVQRFLKSAPIPAAASAALQKTVDTITDAISHASYSSMSSSKLQRRYPDLLTGLTAPAGPVLLAPTGAAVLPHSAPALALVPASCPVVEIGVVVPVVSILAQPSALLDGGYLAARAGALAAAAAAAAAAVPACTVSTCLMSAGRPAVELGVTVAGVAVTLRLVPVLEAEDATDGIVALAHAVAVEAAKDGKKESKKESKKDKKENKKEEHVQALLKAAEKGDLALIAAAAAPLAAQRGADLAQLLCTAISNSPFDIRVLNRLSRQQSPSLTLPAATYATCIRADALTLHYTSYVRNTFATAPALAHALVLLRTLLGEDMGQLPLAALAASVAHDKNADALTIARCTLLELAAGPAHTLSAEPALPAPAHPFRGSARAPAAAAPVNVTEERAPNPSPAIFAPETRMNLLAEGLGPALPATLVPARALAAARVLAAPAGDAAPALAALLSSPITDEHFADIMFDISTPHIPDPSTRAAAAAAAAAALAAALPDRIRAVSAKLIDGGARFFLLVDARQRSGLVKGPAPAESLAASINTAGLAGDGSQAVAQFQATWGERAQLREFASGEVRWCALFDTNTKTKGGVVADMSVAVVARNLGAAAPAPKTGLAAAGLVPKVPLLDRLAGDLTAAVSALDMPLGFVAAEPVHPAVRGTCALPPRGAPIDFVLRFCDAESWPADPAHCAALRTSLLAVAAEGLRAAGLSAAVRGPCIDLVSRDGHLCRLWAHSNGELRAVEDVEPARAGALARRLGALPRLHSRLEAVASGENGQTFRETCAVTKRWLAAHMFTVQPEITGVQHVYAPLPTPPSRRALPAATLGPLPAEGMPQPAFATRPECWTRGADISEEFVELLVASVFLTPMGYAHAPANVDAAFGRVLRLLANQQWRQYPLYLPIADAVTPTPAPVVGPTIVTSDDNRGTKWACDVTFETLERVASRASVALRALPRAPVLALFRAPMGDFDVLVHVKPALVPRHKAEIPPLAATAGAVELPFKCEDHDVFAQLDLANTADRARHAITVNFVADAVAELRRRIGHMFDVRADLVSGTVIGLRRRRASPDALLAAPATAPANAGVDAVVVEVAGVLGDLVERIEVAGVAGAARPAPCPDSESEYEYYSYSEEEEE